MIVSVSCAVGLRVDRRRLVGQVKLELGRADAHVVAVGQHGVVDLLIVDERAVAAVGVADVPGAVLLHDDGVDPRAERIAQRDGALGIAADAILVGRIEQKADAGSTADRHGQVDVHEGGRLLGAAGLEDETVPSAMSNSLSIARPCARITSATCAQPGGRRLVRTPIRTPRIGQSSGIWTWRLIVAPGSAGRTMHDCDRRLSATRCRQLARPPIQAAGGLARTMTARPRHLESARATGCCWSDTARESRRPARSFWRPRALVAQLADRDGRSSPAFWNSPSPTIAEGISSAGRAARRRAPRRRGAGAAVCGRPCAARHSGGGGGGGRRVSAKLSSSRPSTWAVTRRLSALSKLRYDEALARTEPPPADGRRRW